MNIKSIKLQASVAVLLIFTLASCGYRLSGTGGGLRQYMHTISIPVFDNESKEPLIQRHFTDAVRQAFLTDGRLQLAGPKNADLLLTGIIDSYSVRSVAFSEDDFVTESIITLGVTVLVKDQVKKKAYMKNSMKADRDFRSDSLVINSEVARQEALQEAYRDLARQIVALVIDKF